MSKKKTLMKKEKNTFRWFEWTKDKNKELMTERFWRKEN